jgi:ribonucleotide monophosphatase NagD (HAD superfamily)
MTGRQIDSWLMDMEAILVLTGVSVAGQAERYPYRPSRIAKSIDELG